MTAALDEATSDSSSSSENGSNGSNGSTEAGPRWLTAEQQLDWRAFYYGTLRLLDAIDRDLMQEFGIPLAYYEIFVRLSEAPDRSMRMSELAAATRSSRSRLSHAVSRLTESGWAERLDCETDRRGQVAHLTDKGMALLQSAAPDHVESVRRWLVDAVSADQMRTLGAVGRTIHHNVTGEDIPPGLITVPPWMCASEPLTR